MNLVFLETYVNISRFDPFSLSKERVCSMRLSDLRFSPGMAKATQKVPKALWTSSCSLNQPRTRSPSLSVAPSILPPPYCKGLLGVLWARPRQVPEVPRCSRPPRTHLENDLPSCSECKITVSQRGHSPEGRKACIYFLEWIVTPIDIH